MALRLTYLLDDTAISGRAAMTLAQADALIARGHGVRIVTRGLPLTWRGSRAEWSYVGDFSEYHPDDDDFVVATSWTAVQPAWKLAERRAVHLCLEWTVRADAESWSRMPVMVVSKSLASVARAIITDVTCVGAIVDEEFYRPGTPAEHDPPRILLCGQSQDESEGIHEGYGAVAHARWFHQNVDLIRVSPWAPSREEPLDSVQEFHVGLHRNEMARLLHSCDVLVGPAHSEKAFDLPAAEALASGLPALLTSVPPHLEFDDVCDYAVFGPAKNAVELGERLIELLTDEALRERLRTRARQVAAQWHAAAAAERLERFFLEHQQRL